MKVYHEWGYRFNESGLIEDLTTQQRRMIGLAESAEALVEQEAHKQHSNSGSVNTKSGLENRESKRKRIREAKREARKN